MITATEDVLFALAKICVENWERDISRAGNAEARNTLRYHAYENCAARADLSGSDEIAAIYGNASGRFFAAWKASLTFG